MKFGKQMLLASSSTSICSEDMWLDYKKLKKMIKKIPNEVKERPGKEKNQEELLKSSEDERKFFLFLRKELKKVANCYKNLEHQALRKLIKLKSRFIELNELDRVSELSSFVTDCTNVHMDLLMLENYAVLNYAGFAKILKKHDKVTGFRTKEQFLLKLVNSQPFVVHPWLRSAIKTVEEQFRIFTQLTGSDSQTPQTRSKDKTALPLMQIQTPEQNKPESQDNLDLISKAIAETEKTVAVSTEPIASADSSQQREQLLTLLESVYQRRAPAASSSSSAVGTASSVATTGTTTDLSQLLGLAQQQSPTSKLSSNSSVSQSTTNGTMDMSTLPRLRFTSNNNNNNNAVLPDIVRNSAHAGVHQQLFQLHSALERDHSKDWLQNALARASVFQAQSDKQNDKDDTGNASDGNTSAEEESSQSPEVNKTSSGLAPVFSFSRTLDTLAFLAQESMQPGKPRSPSPSHRRPGSPTSNERQPKKQKTNED